MRVFCGRAIVGALMLSLTIINVRGTTSSTVICDETKSQENRSFSDPFLVFHTFVWEEVLWNLDHLENQLRDRPARHATIFVYGGRSKNIRGVVEARVRCMENYLVGQRRIDVNRLTILDAGFREVPTIEFWVVTQDSKPPVPTPTVPEGKATFRKLKVKHWRTLCN
jgi:hypothetical protein